MGVQQSHDKITPLGDLNQMENFKQVKKIKFVLGIIDPQIDMIEQGALAVPKSHRILAPINKLRFLSFDYMDVFLTKNEYPNDHIMFNTTHNTNPFENHYIKRILPDKKELISHQELLPPHCVKKTPGANFHPHLLFLQEDKIFKKGKISSVNSHSAFGDEFACKYENTGLKKWLDSNEITDIILTGLPTETTIFNTGVQAIKLGYQVHIILSCIIDISQDNTDKSINNLMEKGARVYASGEEFFEIAGHKLKLIV